MSFEMMVAPYRKKPGSSRRARGETVKACYHLLVKTRGVWGLVKSAEAHESIAEKVRDYLVQQRNLWIASGFFDNVESWDIVRVW